jgi:hypothetical protein
MPQAPPEVTQEEVDAKQDAATAATDAELAALFVPRMVRKPADETVNNSTAWNNDDHLLLPVLANEIWFIEAKLMLFTTSAAADWQFSWATPAGTVGSHGAYGDVNQTGNSFVTPTQAGVPANLVGAASDVRVAGQAGTVLPTAIHLAGWFTVGATPGNINLRWAQMTATAVDSKVLKDSFLIGWKLG